MSGEYEHTPPPDWCNLRVTEIEAAAPTGDTYDQPQAAYNPDSARFHRAICRA